MEFEKGNILRCVTPPDNKLFFVYIDDNTFIEMVDAKSCMKIVDSSNILKSDFFPIISGEFFEDIDTDLAIMFDKVYTGTANCIFTHITDFPPGDCEIIYNEYRRLFKKGFLLEAKLSDRINEDVLLLNGIRAIKEKDLSTFCDVYDQVTLTDTKVKLFFEANKCLNLACVNACLKRGMYVDVRDDDGNTSMAKIFFLDKNDDLDGDDSLDICKRLVLSGASVDVALSHKPKKERSISLEDISGLRYLSKIREDIKESGDDLE